uniref:Eukaryotic translation initiation factor 5B-like n=1 Tax=Nicotiana tabacum TaxID=4097 RepID=A0A1S3X3W4_TOBAC|nr:PREDICTED: eukaryotic translation initiation factor 5B-like [Nicotiana tabacum]
MLRYFSSKAEGLEFTLNHLIRLYRPQLFRGLIKLQHQSSKALFASNDEDKYRGWMSRCCLDTPCGHRPRGLGPKISCIGVVSEMRQALPEEETESPIPKMGKDNKRKRASKPEDPQDKKAPAQRLRKKFIHVDVDSVHQFPDDEENEGEVSTLVPRTRKPVEAAKPSEPETSPHGNKRRSSLNDASTLFEEAHRLFSQAITKFKAKLSQCEAELKKSSDEEKALRLLCDQKEEEIKDLRADLAKARENEAELDKQVKADCNRWKENIDWLVADKVDALAQLASAETQLRGIKVTNLAQAKKIKELEVKLTEAGAKIAEARAEVERTNATTDKTINVYLRYAEAVQTELREASNREKRSKELAKCQSWRETLEEIHARGFDLTEEITQIRELETNARFLISSDDEDSANGFEGREDEDGVPEEEVPEDA